VVESLNKAVRAVLTTSEVKAKLTAMGAEPAPSTPAELAAVLKTDTEKWSALIKAKGIKGE
jgi:tripartite-type tricarboxylate transporter receptor subunit TctC